MNLSILKKDLKLFFIDKRGVLLAFLLPIILITLFTLAFGGWNTSGSVQKVVLLVNDADSTKISIALVEKLRAHKNLIVKEEPDSVATSLVKKGTYSGVLLIKKGFENDSANRVQHLEYKFDAAKSIQVGMVHSIFNQVILADIKMNEVQSQMNSYFDDNFPTMGASNRAKIMSDMQQRFSQDSGSIKATPVIKEEKKKGNLALIQAVAGTSIMMLLFSIVAIGAGLLEEKEAGTLKRLLTSPIKPREIILSKMGSGLVISIAQLIILLLFAWAVFGLPIFKDPISLLLLVFSIAFAISSFGIFMVAIAKSRQQLQGLSTIVILLMSAIGGSMIPLFTMPAFMQKMAVISVNYWGIQGFFDIFWRELPLIEILPEIGVLLLFGIVIGFVSLRMLNKSIGKFV